MSEFDPRPLAERLRPRSLAEYVGQPHLVAPGRPLSRALDEGTLHSMVLWGPPGTGKTTLARVLATSVEAEFLTLSAVLSGVKEIREAIAEARRTLDNGRRTVLFVDEVHRFNKAQQDAFLPHIESGLVTFIGATTENPAFELNRALLSRARVYTLESLSSDDLAEVLGRGLECLNTDRETHAGLLPLGLSEEAQGLLLEVAAGDARRLLNALEVVVAGAGQPEGGEIGLDWVRAALAGARVQGFDKGGDAFYDQISALHKSVRGSDPDAALYWFARMLKGGCDPLYIARRVVRIASEDIGNADPRALTIALNAWDTQTRLGSPEGELAVAQAIVFLAVAAKSNAVYKAWKAALADAEQHPDLDVPVHLKNAVTGLAKSAGHGAAYRYDHDAPNGYAAGQRYFPEKLGDRQYYVPVARGLESQIGDKLARLRAADAEAEKDKNGGAAQKRSRGVE